MCYAITKIYLEREDLNWVECFIDFNRMWQRLRLDLQDFAKPTEIDTAWLDDKGSFIDKTVIAQGLVRTIFLGNFILKIDEV